jgi:lipid II:glycine glycyltransferase (peptidoglycan interpeptide bridge formation enzyme)
MNIVEALDRKKWDHYVDIHPDGNIFQAPEMHEMYRNARNYEPLLLGVTNEHDEILGVLLTVIQSEDQGLLSNFTRRSIIFGGPLIKNNDLKILDIILQAYDEKVRSKALYSQFRNLWDVNDYLDTFNKNGYKFENHLNIIIDLKKSESLLWQEMNPTRRKQIRRAAKRGTTVKELTEIRDIESAYKILIEVYKNAKLPIPHISLFTESFSKMNSIGILRGFGALYKDSIIGARFILTYRKTIHDWFAGSLYDFRNNYPNDLLPWEIMKWGRQNGFESFDFGGAGKPHEKYGVRDYKKKFGGMLVDYGRLEKIHSPLKYKIAKAGFRLWRTLR